VFQHNGGGTLTVRNFQVSDFGKLYRSCGNCKTQYKRRRRQQEEDRDLRPLHRQQHRRRAAEDRFRRGRQELFLQRLGHHLQVTAPAPDQPGRRLPAPARPLAFSGRLPHYRQTAFSCRHHGSHLRL
jgi:hypothetical protein